ncbi:DUF1240 domain-containing protein [Salinivibrio kushneri]|uniref:DUF1240 domain-containing protein n=1 Tax=Salinivibrio kushneri TaxID=1908198 RepID=A0AB36K5K7_9GAMM|nr:DUF1240 domain-containing protein [Salinivibrio kushneri]OOE43448.1 hypothetical protein BZG09_10735 [Salinivibrio kushneri]
MKKIQISGIVFFALFLVGYLAMGAPAELALPFQSLDPRVRLLGYQSYIALAILPPLLLGGIGIMTHQLCNPQRDVTSYRKAWLKVAYVSLSLVFFALLSRGYLGYQVSKSGYVKCTNESQTSSKNSWRVYAKDLSLCKSASGLADS